MQLYLMLDGIFCVNPSIKLMHELDLMLAIYHRPLEDFITYSSVHFFFNVSVKTREIRS